MASKPWVCPTCKHAHWPNEEHRGDDWKVPELYQCGPSTVEVEGFAPWSKVVGPELEKAGTLMKEARNTLHLPKREKSKPA